MPVFDSPSPITVVLDVASAEIRVLAGGRGETVVEVRASNPARAADVRLAEQASVDFSNGRLAITTPKDWKRFTFFGGTGSLDISVELPAGSHVRATTGLGGFEAEGRLGECEVKTGLGNIRVQDTGNFSANTGHGDIAATVVDGTLVARTGSGDIRIAVVTGNAALRNSNGAIRLGRAGGDVQAKAANGDILMDAASDYVNAKSSNGNVRINGVTRGVIELQTSVGEVEVGIVDGTAAWIEAASTHGRVRNTLAAGEPGESGETAHIQARTAYGDILIRRAS